MKQKNLKANWWYWYWELWVGP